MIVAGRVLDSDGKPVAGAAVDLIAWPRAPWVAASLEDLPGLVPLGRCESDGDGRFRLDAPRTSSSRILDVYALASAPGHALGWVALNPDAEHPAAEITLQPAEPIRIRLVDLIGTPARNVEVRVVGFGRPGGTLSWDRVWAGTNPPEGVRTWPKAVRSDQDGRIVLTGFGPGASVRLNVRDIPYARQDLDIDAGKSAGKETILALEPARIIEGRALAADTGRPLPGAIVSATSFVENEHMRAFITAKFRADAQGRFVMNPLPGEIKTIGAFPTGGEPYLIQQDQFEWPKGAIRATRDIKVPRGVLIRGKVTEAGTGRPLPASSIQFIPVGSQVDGNILSGWQAIVASRDDGSFAIAVAPGKGHLLVFGPSSEYVLEATGQDVLDQGLPAGRRHYAHRIIPYEVKAGDAPLEVAAALRPGGTIRGRVEGPDGQTVTDAQIITTLYIESFNPSWRGDFQLRVRDGRFEVHGVDPEGSGRIHILDAEHEWGATVDLSGKQAGEDLTIRLEPCGKARARFVWPDGKPVTQMDPRAFELVATPGPSLHSRDERDRDRRRAEAAALATIDRRHYKWDRGPRIDDEGRLTLDALIPGALYRIINPTTAYDAKGAQVYKEFTVKPGETLDLGDIVIANPEPQ